MTTTSTETDKPKRPDPISLRPPKDSDIVPRLKAEAERTDRAVNYVVNKILDQHLPPLDEPVVPS